MTMSEQAQYINEVLDLYRNTPFTPGMVRPCDYRFAEELFAQGVPVAIVEMALILAVGRRACRRTVAPPLAPIRTLCYFRPVIEEVQLRLPDPGYLSYLKTVVHCQALLASCEDTQ